MVSERCLGPASARSRSMMRKLSIWLVLLIATAAVASPQTLLGVDYSEPVPFPVVSEYGPPALAARTDAQGSIYLLANGFAGQQATTARNYKIGRASGRGRRETSAV